MYTALAAGIPAISLRRDWRLEFAALQTELPRAQGNRLNEDTHLPKLVTVTALFADGYHNAFTDLIRWKGFYYLSFRTAQHHNLPPNGDVVIYRSADLESWDLSVRFDTGGDDRDPKLIDAGDRLGVVFGTWIPRWGDGTHTIRNADYDLISHVATSRDGLSWSTPRQVYGVNYWLWRILPSDGGFYCPAYHFGVRDDRDQRNVHLLFSEDLFEWRQRAIMRVGDGPGEPVLYHPEAGVLKCVVRTLEPDNHSWIGFSKAPYRDWAWKDLGVMIHAPVVVSPEEGRWIVAGRSQAGDLPADVGRVEDADGRGHHVSIWEIVDNRAVHLLTLPGYGDCSYCGIVYADGDLLLSYYSQHERFPLPSERPTPADVFLARIRL